MDGVSLLTLTIINVENQDFLVYVNRFANWVQPLLCLGRLRPHCGRNLLKILGKPGKALEKILGESVLSE